jgi:hypothetical protein
MRDYVIKLFSGILTNLTKTVLVFTKPSGVTWLIIGYQNDFALSQNFMYLTLGVIGWGTWKRIEKIKKAGG